MYNNRVPDGAGEGVEVETNLEPDADLGGAKAVTADAASAPARNNRKAGLLNITILLLELLPA